MQNFNMPETMETLSSELLTKREAAAFMACSERTIDRWRMEERLPHVHVGGYIRFSREALMQWIRSRTVHAVNKPQSPSSAEGQQ